MDGSETSHRGFYYTPKTITRLRHNEDTEFFSAQRRWDLMKGYCHQTQYITPAEPYVKGLTATTGSCRQQTELEE